MSDLQARIAAAREKGREALSAAALSYRDYWDEDYPQLKWVGEAIDRLVVFERAEAVYEACMREDCEGAAACPEAAALIAAIEEIERA